MKILFPITFSLVYFLPIKLFSQTTNYDDVAVIVNDNSIVSTEITNYFKNARNIPDQNIIHISGPTNEIISTAEFESIKTQIESYLIDENLVDSINYIVTTKGVPLKVNNDCVVGVPSSDLKCASFDSELALFLGDFSSNIGQYYSIPNPLFLETNHFSRVDYGIYLVTRLDGYTLTDILNLIDNSGPNEIVNNVSTNSYVDVSNSSGADLTFFGEAFSPAFDYLFDNQFNVSIDYSYGVVTNQDNILSYLGIGHGPLPYTTMDYHWVSGSFAVMEMCNSSYTFDLALKNPNDLLLSDLISSGCTAGYGNVEYIFFGDIMQPEILLNRYLDTSLHYNLAESFYMASKKLSWQTVIIGDPKASLEFNYLLNLSENIDIDVRAYPNPGTDFVRVESGDIQTIEVRSTDGSLVYTFTSTNGENSKEIQTSTFAPGVYFIQVKTPQGMNTVRWIKK